MRRYGRVWLLSGLLSIGAVCLPVDADQDEWEKSLPPEMQNMMDAVQRGDQAGAERAMKQNIEKQINDAPPHQVTECERQWPGKLRACESFRCTDETKDWSSVGRIVGRDAGGTCHVAMKTKTASGQTIIMDCHFDDATRMAMVRQAEYFANTGKPRANPLDDPDTQLVAKAMQAGVCGDPKQWGAQ